MSRSLIVLARAPSAAGKSRLTAGLAPGVARGIREALLLDTLDAARGAGEPITVCYTPDDAREEVEALAARLGPWAAEAGPGLRPLRFVPQRGDDLGERMRVAFEDAFASGESPVVLVGSDLPDLPPAAVRNAFDALEQGTDLVLGPTADGGYYLIGLTAPHASIFDDIPWSTPDVLARTLERARVAGLSTALVTSWHDVDHAEDARALLAASEYGQARRTRVALRDAGLAAPVDRGRAGLNAGDEPK